MCLFPSDTHALIMSVTAAPPQDWRDLVKAPPSGVKLEDQEKQRKVDAELWEAAAAGDLQTVQKKKEEGGNVNWKHTSKPDGYAHQFTALHIATDKGHTDVVKWLAEKGGADMKAKCPYGETAFEHVQGHQTADNSAAMCKAMWLELARQPRPLLVATLSHAPPCSPSLTTRVPSTLASTAYLKMKTAMNAVMAAQKFKASMGKK